MDLEMHIVHKLEMDNEIKSQFSHGVLAILFKIVPDSYFLKNSKYHDLILS